MMSKEWMDKKEFDVKAIIEDAIANLMLQGMKHDSALSLLAFQSLIRMDNAEQAVDVMESVKDLIISSGGDDDDDDNPGGREAA